MSETDTHPEAIYSSTARNTSLNEIFSVSLSEDRLLRWAILDYWTPTEAAAIVMEMDPSIAQWEKIRTLPESDPSVQRFRDIRRLLMRSAKITEEPAPRAIVRFIRSKGLNVPQYIFDAVQKVGVKPTSKTERYWKRKYHELEALHKNAIQSDNCRRVRNIKIIVGYLAIVHANVKIEGKNSLYKQIDSDLADCEAHISDDTARNIVKECIDLLNSEDGLVERLTVRARNERLRDKKPNSD